MKHALTLVLLTALPGLALGAPPATAPTPFTPDAGRGFCETRHLPLRPESARVAFADATARAGIDRFFGALGLARLSAPVYADLISGAFQVGGTNAVLEPGSVFLAASASRDGAIVAPARFQQAAGKLLTPVSIRTYYGARVYLFPQTCTLAVALPPVPLDAGDEVQVTKVQQSKDPNRTLPLRQSVTPREGVSIDLGTILPTNAGKRRKRSRTHGFRADRTRGR